MAVRRVWSVDHSLAYALSVCMKNKMVSTFCVSSPVISAGSCCRMALMFKKVADPLLLAREVFFLGEKTLCELSLLAANL